MKIFLCHSGDRSLKVAEALHCWLPIVLQKAKPFISNESIPKGQQWWNFLATQFEETSMCIICLTPENLTSTWIHFEAGALFKGSETSHICTYLFEVDDPGLPLSSFQSTKAEKEDTFRLIRMINERQVEEAIHSDVLQAIFDKFWDDLKSKLDSISKDPQEQKASKRTQDEKLDELLILIRGLVKKDEVPQEQLSDSASRVWKYWNFLKETEDKESMREFTKALSMEKLRRMEARLKEKREQEEGNDDRQ